MVTDSDRSRNSVMNTTDDLDEIKAAIESVEVNTNTSTCTTQNEGLTTKSITVTSSATLVIRIFRALTALIGAFRLKT